MINFKSGLLYCIMASLAIPALVILIVCTAIYGTTLDIISYTLFGSSLFLLFLFNTLYYWIKNKTAIKVFLRFKHILSYIFLASTYTCICLGPLVGPWGWSIFGIVWGLSVLCIIFSSIWSNIPEIILVISKILISLVLFVALKPLSCFFLKISFIGTLLFTISYAFFIISGIIKLSNIKKLEILSDIFLIFGAITTYLFFIKYLLFI